MPKKTKQTCKRRICTKKVLVSMKERTMAECSMCMSSFKLEYMKDKLCINCRRKEQFKIQGFKTKPIKCDSCEEYFEGEENEVTCFVCTEINNKPIFSESITSNHMKYESSSSDESVW